MFCSNCGKEIQENVKFCPHCGENIKDSSGLPRVKYIDTIFFIGLNIITVGIYNFIWLLRRYKALNALSKSKYHNISWVMIFLCFLNSIMTPFNFFNTIVTSLGGTLNYQIPTWVNWVNIISGFGILILTIKIIKIIEGYALYQKQKVINHNIVWMLILNLLYANFAIESFIERVKKGQSIDEKEVSEQQTMAND